MNQLNSIVSVSSRFQRSVNIAAERQRLFDGSDCMGDYQLLGSSIQILETLALYLSQTNQRAFTITGPYGCGKSSLGLFLCALAGQEDSLKKVAKDKLTGLKEEENVKKLSEPGRRVIVFNGRKGSLAEDLNKVFFPDLRQSDFIDNLKAHPSIIKEPTLLMIDELGRYVAGGQMENCAVLQDLAEIINSSGSNFVFIGILHQNLSAYSDNRSEKDEWAKVQGRFLDLPLISHMEETLKILSEAIAQESVPEKSRLVVEKAVSCVLKHFQEKSLISTEIYRTSFLKSWPVNPIVCLLLGSISRRNFWQNARSIFSFLTSREPFGFQHFLETTSTESTELYSPYHLWDYLNNNFSHLIIPDRSDGHRWVNAIDCIERTKNKGSEDHVRMVQVIAMISIFNTGTGIDSNKLILQASQPYLSLKKIGIILQDLVEWKIIISRREHDTYALYDAGNFDIEKEKTKYKELQIDTEALNKYVRLPSIVAKRYYAETGNIRLFNFEFSSREQINYAVKDPKDDGINRIYLLLDIFESSQERAAFIFRLKEFLQLNPSKLMLIAIPNNAKKLASFAQEILIMRRISQDPLLEGDRVSRAEVAKNIDQLLSQFREEVSHLHQGISWILPGGVLRESHDDRELNALLSDLCHKIYPLTPYFHNELVNRNKTSVAGRTALKKLIFAMVNQEEKKRLGMTGTPAEVMIYMTLFENNALHRQQSDGTYAFTLPQDLRENSERIRRFWKKTEQILSERKIIDVLELYSLWQKPPFGLKAAAMPIFLMYFFLVNKESMSFYQDDMYEPFLTPEVVDLFLANPKHLKIRYHKNKPANNDLGEKFFAILKNYDESLKARDTLSIARSLVKILLEQPKWVQITVRASPRTKAYREAVSKAHDPVELLYTELPKIFETKENSLIVSRTKEVLDELEKLNKNLIHEIKVILYRAIDAEEGKEKELRARAKKIINLTNHLQLKRFISNLIDFRGEDEEVEKILGLTTGKLSGKWTDSDIDNARTKISDLAFSFRHLEGLATLDEAGTGARRLFGLVLAGEKGRTDVVVDIPSKLPLEAKKVRDNILKGLKTLPKELAIAVLIESGLELEKKNG